MVSPLFCCQLRKRTKKFLSNKKFFDARSGKAERISVPAKWIRTARHYELNIYTHNKSYQAPFALTGG